MGQNVPLAATKAAYCHRLETGKSKNKQGNEQDRRTDRLTEFVISPNHVPNSLQVPGLYLPIGRVLMLHDGPSPCTMNGPSTDTNSPLHGLNYAIGTGNSLGRDTPPG